jgi:glycosyltransferase involved in cell wall biosynthesis
MESPQVCVIIPTKNRAPYIKYTLNTCVAQDYKNLRIIVVDDNGNDATGEIVNKFENCDSRVQYLRHDKNLGMLSNFEYAVRQADDSDYIIILGGDDGLMPNGISEMVDKIRSQNVFIYLMFQTLLFRIL